MSPLKRDKEAEVSSITFQTAAECLAEADAAELCVLFFFFFVRCVFNVTRDNWTPGAAGPEC